MRQQKPWWTRTMVGSMPAILNHLFTIDQRTVRLHGIVMNVWRSAGFDTGDVSGS
jgi:hypothetical protein